MARNRKSDGLESKVFEIPKKVIIRDDIGRYLPFCDYPFHRGISERPKVCEARQCQHYQKLYISYKRYKKHDNNRNKRKDTFDEPSIWF